MANVGSGVGSTESVIKGVISGEDSVTAAESGPGSFIASTDCVVLGAGSSRSSVMTGGSVTAGSDGVVSSAWLGTSTGVEYVAKAGSGAGISSTESDTDGSNVTGDTVAAVGSAVVISFAAIGSVAGVPAVSSVNIGCGNVTWCGSGGEESGCGHGG